MDFVEATCISVLVLRLRKEKQKRRQFWVHPMISARLTDGQFYKLFDRLREHPNKFLNYFRMGIECFDNLLRLVGPHISYKNTRLRLSVPPQERLAVTLRYLATGDSFSSLHHEYLLGNSTIRGIVRDTCDVLWECLTELYMPKLDCDAWLKIADGFNEKMQFPNCIGAIDGKQIRIKNRNSSGSEFNNCKSFFSTELLAIVDSNYKFIYIDVGADSSSSDSNIFKKSRFSKLLEKNKLNIPKPQHLPNDDNGTEMPFILVGDEAFALSQFVLRPYSSRKLPVNQCIFNDRLKRVCRMVECAFAILENKWRIFQRPIDTSIEFGVSIIKACCILHNYVVQHDGIPFEETLYECALEDIPAVGVRSNVQGSVIRDYFANYFVSPQGCVPCQYDLLNV